MKKTPSQIIREAVAASGSTCPQCHVGRVFYNDEGGACDNCGWIAPSTDDPDDYPDDVAEARDPDTTPDDDGAKIIARRFGVSDDEARNLIRKYGMYVLFMAWRKVITPAEAKKIYG